MVAAAAEAGAMLRVVLEVPVELAERRYSISVGHDVSRLLPDLLEGLRGRKTVPFLDARLGRGLSDLNP